MNRNRQEKGITLIALVVTIIILLILSGVALGLVAGKEGILNRAKEVVDKSNKISLQEEIELEIASLRIAYHENKEEFALEEEYVKNKLQAPGVDTSKGKVILDGESLKIDEVEIGTYREGIVTIGNAVNSGNTTAGKNDKSKNRALSGETNGYSYKNPIIPQGFVAVDEGDAIWKYTDNQTVEGWNNGLVIQDELENQFVWVPIDGEGVIYELLSEKENTVHDVDAYPSGVEDELDQISSYGGFYVARYEAGKSTASDTVTPSSNNVYNITKTGLPVSKKGEKIWNFIRYATAKKVSKAMINDEIKYGKNKSGLITGRQWDSIMRWFEESGIGVREIETTNSKGETVPVQDWGSYSNLEYTMQPGYYIRSGNYEQASWLLSSKEILHKQGTSTYIHASGLNPDGIRKNIADLGGNCNEYVAMLWVEQNSKTERLAKGSCCSKHEFGNFVPYYKTGFRVVLYVTQSE